MAKTKSEPKVHYCLVCKIEVAEEHLDWCARRQSDGEPVCPVCTEKIRSGNAEALNKLSNARQVFN